MASWLLKALVQRSIAALPNPRYWNELLQERVTRSLELTDERFDGSLNNCTNHWKQFQRYGSTGRDSFSAFELGTGWFPVVPIGLFLCGAREVWTWDVAPLLKLDRLKLTIGRFLELDQRQRLQDHLPVLPERVAALREVMTFFESSRRREPVQLLERIGIHYRVGNASRSGLASEAVDLIVSDVTLEYVSPAELYEILREFRRIAAPGAVMSHSIDLSDQYASFDPSITKFNFLRYSDSFWRRLSNPIISLSRLRISDYRRAFSDSHFQIVHEFSLRGDPTELARTPVATRFHDYDIDDLLVLHTQLVSVPASN
jgi:methyltransferase family protein